jgi:hypothetical protein
MRAVTRIKLHTFSFSAASLSVQTTVRALFFLVGVRKSKYYFADFHVTRVMFRVSELPLMQDGTSILPRNHTTGFSW